MNKPNIIKIFKKVNAIIVDDHFVYTSGKHGSVYINKDALYPHTNLISLVGKMIAQKHLHQKIDVVVGPALGGIILAQWTAYHLAKLTKRDVLGVYTEKDSSGNQIFSRGYDKLIVKKRVLVVEDLTTTGGSVKKVMDKVNLAGGKVVAVEVMLNRDPIACNSKTIGVPFSALDVLLAEAFDEDRCPYCKTNRPINTSIGHGRMYLQEKQKKGV